MPSIGPDLVNRSSFPFQKLLLRPVSQRMLFNDLGLQGILHGSERSQFLAMAWRVLLPLADG
jgi:hypothetical protein